jgi:hypothetical protein
MEISCLGNEVFNTINFSGAEFFKSEKHSAGQISIRFPRVTRIRDDKKVSDATSLKELIDLYNLSKEKDQIDFETLIEKEKYHRMYILKITNKGKNLFL